MCGSREALLVLGCGYLGCRLVAEATRRGIPVKAVSRSEEALAKARRAGAATYAGMVGEDSWHGFAGTSIRWVVNCVGAAGGGLEGYRKSYVEGNHSLSRWASLTAFSGSAIYTSSVSVYPDARGDWLDEQCPQPPDNERGRLIRESEKVFLEGGIGSRRTALRLGGLYGPGRHLILDQMRQVPSTLPGSGEYHLNLLRIEDAAAAVFACLQSETALAAVYTVVDDEPTRKSELVAWLARRLSQRPPVFEGCLLGSRHQGAKEGGRADRKLSNGLLKRELDWRPRFPSFREGYEDLLSAVSS